MVGIMGHRGAKSIAPENTLASIKKVVESGAKWIEVDVQLSADKIPVIFHDETVERCTDGKGIVTELRLTELKVLDAGCFFSSDFKNEQIPTLKEVIIFCQENDLSINLELKIYQEDSKKELVKKVIETVKALNFSTSKIIFSSFSETILTYIYKLYPEVRRGLIADKEVLNLPDIKEKLSLYSFHVDHKILNEKLAKSVKKLGLVLMIWTLNDPTQANKFSALGVDYIITDKPNEF